MNKALVAEAGFEPASLDYEPSKVPNSSTPRRAPRVTQEASLPQTVSNRLLLLERQAA